MIPVYESQVLFSKSSDAVEHQSHPGQDVLSCLPRWASAPATNHIPCSTRRQPDQMKYIRGSPSAGAALRPHCCACRCAGFASSGSQRALSSPPCRICTEPCGFSIPSLFCALRCSHGQSFSSNRREAVEQTPSSRRSYRGGATTPLGTAIYLFGIRLYVLAWRQRVRQPERGPQKCLALVPTVTLSRSRMVRTLSLIHI